MNLDIQLHVCSCDFNKVVHLNVMFIRFKTVQNDCTLCI